MMLAKRIGIGPCMMHLSECVVGVVVNTWGEQCQPNDLVLVVTMTANSCPIFYICQ